MPALKPVQYAYHDQKKAYVTSCLFLSRQSCAAEALGPNTVEGRACCVYSAVGCVFFDDDRQMQVTNICGVPLSAAWEY